MLHSTLALLVVCVVSLLLPATALVFTVGRRRAHVRAHVRAQDRGTLGVAGAAVLVALASLGLAALLGAEPVPATLVALVLAGSVLVWLPMAAAWAVRGVVAWGLTVTAGLSYLAYVLHWMLTSDLGAAALVAGGVLWLLELFVLVLAWGYVWELVDVVARRSWPRRVTRAERASDDGPRPFVSVHVPCHNEPPDMVVETLEWLLRQDYDDYEILLVDNNTDDPALWRPVEEFCARHDRIRFFHLEDWPGYKSGALNFALHQVDPRTEVVAIVDADYHVQPDFLSRCTPLFTDPQVAFVQTPQDYRDWEQAGYFRRLYFSYGYFFDVSQRSRNERDGAIFGGTMGLIRLEALSAVGGWDEWCITEDAELSLRLLRAGWSGRHVEESYGHGVMPLTFEALKRQRFRWCFGGVQILRLHWRSLLPGRRTESNRLTLAQRGAYLVGALQWFGDLAGLVFTGFLLLGVWDAAFGAGVVVRRLSGLILVCVLALVVLGAVRALTLLRRTSGATWGEAIGAFGLWLGLGWVVAQASARGLVAREGTFLRTPKVRGDVGWRDSIRGNRTEILLALACLTGAALAWSRPAVGTLVLGALLAIQAAGYLAAPLNSIAALAAYLPPDLRRRRREQLASWSRAAATSGRFVLAPATAAAVAAMAFVVLAAPADGPRPGDLPDQAAPEPRTEAPTPTPRGTGSPGTAASSLPSRPSATTSGTATTPGGADAVPVTRTSDPWSTAAPTPSVSSPTSAGTTQAPGQGGEIPATQPSTRPTPTQAAVPTRGPR